MSNHYLFTNDNGVLSALRLYYIHIFIYMYICLLVYFVGLYAHTDRSCWKFFILLFYILYYTRLTRLCRLDPIDCV